MHIHSPHILLSTRFITEPSKPVSSTHRTPQPHLEIAGRMRNSQEALTRVRRAHENRIPRDGAPPHRYQNTGPGVRSDSGRHHSRSGVRSPCGGHREGGRRHRDSTPKPPTLGHHKPVSPANSDFRQSMHTR